MNKVLLLIGVTLVAQGFVYAAYPGSQTPPCSVHGMDQGYPGSQTPENTYDYPGHHTPRSPQRQVPMSPPADHGRGGPGMSYWDLQQMALDVMKKQAACEAKKEMDAIPTGQDAQLLQQGANRSDAAKRENV